MFGAEEESDETKGVKILLASAAFYPEVSPRSFRATELAVELVRQGHEVKLLTTQRSEATQLFCKANGIPIQCTAPLTWRPVGSGSFFQRLWRRMLLMAFEYPAVELMFRFKTALNEEQGYDLLMSFAVPHPVHWGVAWARSKNRIARTWVADCGDPYMGNESDSFKPLFYMGYLEKWFCRKADYIAVPTTEAKKAYFPQFHQKIVVIPQGFNFEEIQKFKSETENSVPTFAYSGNFILGYRDPTLFLKYLTSSNKKFNFLIYTNTPELVRPFLASAGNRIELYPFVSRSELLKALGAVDFFVNFENKGTSQTPSKLIDYAILGKPILSIGSELETEIIDQFLTGNYQEQFQVQHIEQYRIEKVARQFVALTATST